MSNQECLQVKTDNLLQFSVQLLEKLE